VYVSDFQKEGSLTAELKQEIVTTSFYPTKQISTNLQDNIFSAADFNYKEEEFKSNETRVAWIDVPVGSTVESVTLKLAVFKNANLYKILGNRPILNTNQMYAISTRITTEDAFADKQVLRYPKGSDKAGRLIIDKHAKVQYRTIMFMSTGAEDVDYRTADASDVYMSASIEAEVNSTATTNSYVVAGQHL
jgi:hypothetical protein